MQSPVHYGFGSKLIERSVAYELDGTSRMEFHAAGLRCELKIPLASITAMAIPGGALHEKAGATFHEDTPPKAS